MYEELFRMKPHIPVKEVQEHVLGESMPGYEHENVDFMDKKRRRY
jgi:hypothetical protein